MSTLSASSSPPVGSIPVARSGQEACGPMSAASSSLGTSRKRQLLGIGVVAAVLLLQAFSQYLSGYERARVLSHLAFIGTEMPVIALSLSATYRAVIRRKLRPFHVLMACVIVPGVLGVLFGGAQHWIAQLYPSVLLHPRIPNLWRSLLYGFTYAQFQAGLWTLAFVLPLAIDDARIRGLEAEQLRSAAELARLRANLEPHFLLNTLNAIAGLVTEDPREARRLIACLGDLLRDALRDDTEMQRLDEQVAWLQRYAAILQARHGDAVKFEWDIAPEVRGALLPRLLLQPLVENAVKHGALVRREGGIVRVSAQIAGKPSGIVCTVEDNGPGPFDTEVRAGAFGLHAVRRRLELRYAGATLKLESSGEGTRSIVTLPRDSVPNDTSPAEGRA
jgi:signal transduction histidine kinase